MKVTDTIMLRVPESFAGLGSAEVRSMLAGFLQRPVQLGWTLRD